MTAVERLVEALAPHHVKPLRDGYRAKCPAHDGQSRDSLSVRQIEGQALVHCFGGCDTADVMTALSMTMRDLFDEPGGARYAYTDDLGTPTRYVTRTPDKRFRQSGDTMGQPQLYRLPQVLEAVAAGTTVYVVEGEKDVHAVEAAGGVATTSPMGATNWSKVDPSPLTGAQVIVVPDKDKAGDSYLRDVVTSLEGRAASIRVMRAKVGKDAADHIAAGHTLDELVEEPPPEIEAAPGQSWGAVDLSDVVSGLLSGSLERLTPTVGMRQGGGALFYAGKVNGVAGASGSGKTWTALASCCQEVAAGRHVIYIDLEDDAVGIVSRLLDLGADPADVLARFHYVRPDEPHRPAAHRRLLGLIEEVVPTLIVIDSTGESLALDGMKPNDDDDVARWFRSLPGPLARMGPAVVVLDHVVKADDGGLWPIGSQRKRAAVSGAQYMQLVVRPFAKGQRGAAKLVCAKDRHGTYRQGEKVAELLVEPDGERLTFTLKAPEVVPASAAAFRPTALMDRVSRFLEDADEPSSRKTVTDRVRGNRTALLDALDVLKAEGYVEVTIGTRKAELCASRRPYRQTDDPLSDAYRAAQEQDEPEHLSSAPPGPVPTCSFPKGKEHGTGENRPSDLFLGTSEEQVRNKSEGPAACRDCGQALLLHRPGRDRCERCRVQAVPA